MAKATGMGMGQGTAMGPGTGTEVGSLFGTGMDGGMVMVAAIATTMA